MFSRDQIDENTRRTLFFHKLPYGTDKGNGELAREISWNGRILEKLIGKLAIPRSH